jgi:hypothetical protein
MSYFEQRRGRSPGRVRPHAADASGDLGPRNVEGSPAGSLRIQPVQRTSLRRAVCSKALALAECRFDAASSTGSRNRRGPSDAGGDHD